MPVQVPYGKRKVPANQRFLNYDQAARRAGVSKRTVQAWVYAGKLKVFRQGRIVRIDVDVLDEFLGAA